MYNRKQLCLLAGLDIEAFKHAAKNDDLPILSTDGSLDRSGDRGSATYSKYSAKDVLAVACAAQLAAGGGYLEKAMPFASASKVVSNQIGMLGNAVRLARLENTFWFLGYAPMNGEYGTAGINVGGTLKDIAEKVLLQSDSDFSGLYLFAPSNVAAAIERRAKANGIDWNAEHLWSGE